MSFSCPSCHRQFGSAAAQLKHAEASGCLAGYGNRSASANVHKGVRMWENSRSQQGFLTGNTSHFVGPVTITDAAYDSDEDAWVCFICDRQFLSRRALEQHVNSGTHDGAQNYQCRECGRGFSRASALAEHAQKKHGQSMTCRLTNVLSHDFGSATNNTKLLTDGHGGKGHEALLRFDGGCRPNPGYGGAGFVLQDTIRGWMLERRSEPIQPYGVTNNIAEYFGLMLGLKAAVDQCIRRLRVEGDSQLVIEQMLKNWTVNSPNLIDLNHACQKLAKKFESISFHHISRERNADADRLASQAVTDRTNWFCG